MLGGSCLLALLLCACVVVEQRLQFTPEPVPTEIRGARWRQTPITYCIVREGEGGFVEHDTFVTLAGLAMAAWGLPTTYQGACAGSITADNGTNEIGWGDLSGDPGRLTEAGKTYIRYRSNPLGGPPEITEADVTIERRPARGRDTEECLYTTLLHESGHILGVPHLSMSTVMAPVISDCLQQLTPADRAALDELY